MPADTLPGTPAPAPTPTASPAPQAPAMPDYGTTMPQMPAARIGVTQPNTPSQTAANRMIEDSKSAISDHTNRSFQDWYGQQHPDFIAKFAPSTPVGGTLDAYANGIRTHIGSSDEERAAITDSATRQAARAYYIKNELPKDPTYQTLMRQQANAQVYRMTGQLPQMPRQAPTAGPNQRSSTVYGSDNQPIRTTISDLPPAKPGTLWTKPIGEGLAKGGAALGAGIGKAGTALAGAIKDGQKAPLIAAQTGLANARADAITNKPAPDKSIAQSNAADHARLSVMAQRESEIYHAHAAALTPLTPEEQAEVTGFAKERENLIGGMRTRGAPATQPAPGGVGSGGGPIGGSPATSTQPFQGGGRGARGTPAATQGSNGAFDRGNLTPAEVANGGGIVRGPLTTQEQAEGGANLLANRGQLPYAQGTHDVEGATGTKDGKPVEFRNGQWQFVQGGK